MMSHTGSRSRSARSPGGTERSVASGAVRSAILTYFRQVAMGDAATPWIVALPDVAPSAIVAPYRYALVGPPNIPGVGPGRKSVARERQANIDCGSARLPQRRPIR